MSWHRRLWGVEFFHLRSQPPMLLGQGWDTPDHADYPGEPTHALLFTTRAQARTWCTAKQLTYVGRTDGCGAWRFRAVPVWERVSRVTR